MVCGACGEGWEPPACSSRTQQRGRGGEAAGGLSCSRTAHSGRWRDRVAWLTHLLAERAHRRGGQVGQAPSCARAPLTQDLMVPGLGGWSDRRTRAVGGNLADAPEGQRRGGGVPGDPLCFVATGRDARSLRPPCYLSTGISERGWSVTLGMGHRRAACRLVEV